MWRNCIAWLSPATRQEASEQCRCLRLHSGSQHCKGHSTQQHVLGLHAQPSKHAAPQGSFFLHVDPNISKWCSPPFRTIKLQLSNLGHHRSEPTKPWWRRNMLEAEMCFQLCLLTAPTWRFVHCKRYIWQPFRVLMLEDTSLDQTAGPAGTSQVHLSTLAAAWKPTSLRRPVPQRCGGRPAP